MIDSLSIPNGWALTTLGNVLLAVVGGGTPSRRVPAYFDGSIPWFTVKDMKALKPGDAEEHISEAAIIDSATNLIPENTLIVATRIALGRAIRPTIACAINQDLKALIVGTGIDADFLLYWVGANERIIQDLGSGTTVSGIRLETLHALKLLLPPSAEQTRIVEKLEELLSDLDAGVAELKAAQKKLAQYRQSLLKAAVEGALTAEWRASRKSVRPELVEGRFSVLPQTDSGESNPARSQSVHPSTSSGRTDLLVDAQEYSPNPVRPELVEGRFSVLAQTDSGESNSACSKSVHPSTSSGRTDLPVDAQEYSPNLVRPEPVDACPEFCRRGRAGGAETGAQLLERILKERRARWEAKQLAKFQEQGKTPPKDWKTKYPEPVKPDTTNLPELPEGWVWASAEQICDFITKGTTPPKGLNSSDKKAIPFLRVTNLTANGDLDFTDKVFVTEDVHRGFLARSAVYPGDVLMNIVGPPLGQVSVVPADFAEWNINQAIAIFRAVEGILPRFVCLCLLSPSVQHWLKARAKTTAGQSNLTLEICRSLPIPLPPSVEQQALVEAMETTRNGIFEQELAIHFSLKQSATQRKNILKAAFSGQLVPQDPNDEPASVLLERIRAERAARAKDGRKPGGRKVKGTA